MIPDRPIGLRIRWWWWLIAIVLLVATALIAVRIGGQRRLEATQAELRAAGFAVTPVELVAQAPPVDVDRQNRLWRLVGWPAPGWMDEHQRVPISRTLAEPPPMAPADVDRLDRVLAAAAPDLDELDRIFAEGPVLLSGLGWVERDPTRLASVDIATIAATRIPNLLAVRALCQVSAHRAVAAADPEADLRRLDAILDAQRHPAVLIDGFIAIAASAIRDQAHAWLALRGRLPAERLAAWAAETPPQRQFAAAGMAGERCLFQEPLGRLHWGFGGLSGSTRLFSECVWFVRVWPTQGYEIACMQAAAARAQATLTDQPQPSEQHMPFAAMGPLMELGMMNTTESMVTACEAANRHRLVRAIALIAQAYRRTGRLPAELPPGMDAGTLAPDLPALRYEIFPPARVRVGIDPAGPLPPSVPADRWKPGYGSSIGGPPRNLPVSPDSERWSLEIDLDAILVPPPAPAPRKPKPPASSPQPPASP
jgi:hypothetical protein